jgi:hypothetical protein
MRARSVAGLSLLGLVLWWWTGDDPAPRHHGETAPQIAVLHDGFVVMRGDGHGAVRLTELGHDGKPRREHAVAIPSDEVRVVGTRIGAGLVWRDATKRRVQLTIVDRNGRWRDDFGSDDAVRLCDGLASNDHRFGVGWFDSRGGVWFVHGPTQPAAAELPAGGEVSWCAITGSLDGIGLLWRERDALRINICSKGRCPMVETVSRTIAHRPILGFGCLGSECIVVTRGPSERAEVTMLSRRGGVKWTRPLPGELAGDAVMAIGAGQRFVVAYGMADRAEAVAFDRKGNSSTIWTGPAAGNSAAPAIAWSRGQLAIARLHEGVVVTEVVALPRVTP